MKIGVISDSHDNLPKIESAVEYFNHQKVDFVLHAGDFVAPFTVVRLKKLNCDWLGVFGNNDGERDGLSKISEGKIKEGPLSIELAQRKIILIHDLDKLISNSATVDLVIFGHTHNTQIKKIDSVLFFNPGECGGWLTNRSTVGIVDLDLLSAEIVPLDSV